MMNGILRAAAAGAVLFAQAAAAQTATVQAGCGNRVKMAEKLVEQFGEAQTGAGVVGSNAILEFWRSKDGSWTILMTRADGLSCIIAAGDHWNEVRRPVGNPI